MKDTFGLIYLSDTDMQLRELTRSRPTAAIPFGGRYRIIDVMLSTLVNSGITNVGLITQKNYHSIMDHLGSGKEWDLDRKRDGLFILPPFVTRHNTGTYTGLLDALRSNIGYIRRSSQRYCLLTGSETVFNMDYHALLKQHIATGADITIAYNEPEESTLAGHETGRVHMLLNETGRVTDIEYSTTLNRYPAVGMGVYLMDKNLLTYLIEVSASHYRTDFIRDVLIAQNDNLKIFGYKYDGYVSRIESIQSYYQLNMDLLDEGIRNQLLSRPNPVYTKVKDEVPAQYFEGARIENSLVADGCIIEGEVKNSVLFRGVRVGKGAKVENCILMQATEVQDSAQLAYVITDKSAFIKRGKRLMGQASFPIVIEKNAVI